MQQKGPVSVLVAPLNWGLGHATRCIPIIKELTHQGALVIIAASGGQKTLLQLEFPLLEFLEIPGYEITYKQGVLLKWGLILTIPALLKTIRRENKWLSELIRLRKIDAVISDNRYGFFHSDRYCVFMAHQLAIQTGFGKNKRADNWQLTVSRWIERKLLKWNYRFISKFSCCWVPDYQDDLSLAGKLSNPPKLPSIPVKYIGILSRFQFEEKKRIGHSLLILISGPEPQRTEFEKIILNQLSGCAMRTVVVRGLPGSHESIHLDERIRICNHLPSNEMNALLNESEYIVARAGYSTIMDLVKVRRSAILVPTPGQTEQEYLGRYLHEKKWMYCIEQKNFKLNKALEIFKEPDFTPADIQNTLLPETIADFLTSVKRQAYSGA